MNTDGTGRDGVLRKVTAVTDHSLEIDPPLHGPPDFGGVVLFKWPEGQKNLVPDFHVGKESPAAGSAEAGDERRSRGAFEAAK